jgi:hypothetical protein
MFAAWQHCAQQREQGTAEIHILATSAFSHQQHEPKPAT